METPEVWESMGESGQRQVYNVCYPRSCHNLTRSIMYVTYWISDSPQYGPDKYALLLLFCSNYSMLDSIACNPKSLN